MGCTCKVLLETIERGLSVDEIKKELNITDKELLYSLKLLKSKGYLIDKKFYNNGTYDFSICNPVSLLPYGVPIYTEKDEDKIRLLFISDIHMFHKNASLEAVENAYNYCINNDIHVIVLCGDMIDALNYNKTPIVEQGEDFIKKYPFQQGILNIALMGNHEVLYSKKSGIDFNKLLEDNRLDFKTLGYKNGLIYIKNDCINIHHSIDNCNVITSQPYSSRLTFLGHSHIHKINDKNIYVPTLSYVKVANPKDFGCFPMALDVTFSIGENKSIKEALIDQISLNNNPFILSETVTKNNFNPLFKDSYFEVDSYVRTKNKK